MYYIQIKGSKEYYLTGKPDEAITTLNLKKAQSFNLEDVLEKLIELNEYNDIYEYVYIK